MGFRRKVLAHQRHNSKVFEVVPRWQLLGGKTRVRFQACLHDQGQLHLLLRSACCDAEVSKISDFSLSSSGTCPGDRPKYKKKDTKFVPTCNPGETKAAVHPFRDVKSWFQCLGTITGKQYS